MSAKERKLRKALCEMGYQLHKSRARNWSYDNQLGYMITSLSYNTCVAGSRYDLSLEDVEEFVME